MADWCNPVNAIDLIDLVGVIDSADLDDPIDFIGSIDYTELFALPDSVKVAALIAVTDLLRFAGFGPSERPLTRPFAQPYPRTLRDRPIETGALWRMSKPTGPSKPLRDRRTRRPSSRRFWGDVETGPLWHVLRQGSFESIQTAPKVSIVRRRRNRPHNGHPSPCIFPNRHKQPLI